jgi:hypothetical protein
LEQYQSLPQNKGRVQQLNSMVKKKKFFLFFKIKI